MSDATIRLYEGLFLVNPTTVASSLEKAAQVVQDLLNRAQAEVVSISKWEERKLAYEISGVKRGLYMLAYFKLDGRKIASIERDVTLSDNVLRCLILRADHIGETELKAAIEAQTNTRLAAKLQAEGAAAEPAPTAAPAAASEPAAV